EVETRCGFAGNQQKRGIAPHTSSVSLRSTASPQGEAMSAPVSVRQLPIYRTDKGRFYAPFAVLCDLRFCTAPIHNSKTGL
ncbi:MAG: hypothetical protein SPE18_07560, partial [Candidatus Limivicinus sp.]|nr:hypothetical protein [Candidatus Limivicinus sp.]